LEDYDSYIKYWAEMLWLWTRWRGEFFFRCSKMNSRGRTHLRFDVLFLSLLLKGRMLRCWPELAIKGSSRTVDLRTCTAAHFWFIARGRSFRKQTARKLIEEF